MLLQQLFHGIIFCVPFLLNFLCSVIHNVAATDTFAFALHRRTAGWAKAKRVYIRPPFLKGEVFHEESGSAGAGDSRIGYSSRFYSHRIEIYE